MREIHGLKLHDGLDQRRVRLIRHHLTPLLKTCFGYHALCYGQLVNQLGIRHCPIRAIHFMVQPNDLGSHPRWDRRVTEPAAGEEVKSSLIADYSQLPIASDAVDLIVMPATLQLSDNPHGILREAERVLIPHGRLMIIGRNPLSWQGLARRMRCWLLRRENKDKSRDISRLRLKDWLKLLGLELEEEIGVSLTNEKIQMGRAGKWSKKISNYFCEYFCSYFILVAEKKGSTLTPIRPSWRTNKRLVPPRIAEPSVRKHIEKRAVE